MRPFPVITDPIYIIPEHLTASQSFWLRYLNDKKDLPFMKLLLKVHLSVVPLAVILFTPLLSGVWWWLTFVLYTFLAAVFFRGPFGLMLHSINHRRFFKKEYDIFNKYIIWFIAPIFGHTPESYAGHHVGMHHVENNQDDDTSCNLYYQRDSIVDFFKYYLNFIFLGVGQTFLYLVKRKKKKYYIPFSIGESSFYIFCAVMCFVSIKAAVLILIVPCLISRMVMMLGNWTQHAFADPKDPENLYRNCVTCINTNYNTKCWNDGYHLIHHLKPGYHYTQMPVEFLRIKDKVASEKALVFEGIHYLHIFKYLMTKRYDKMADYLVNINGTFGSREEAILVMKERTRKFQSLIPVVNMAK